MDYRILRNILTFKGLNRKCIALRVVFPRVLFILLYLIFLISGSLWDILGALSDILILVQICPLLLEKGKILTISLKKTIVI